MKLRGICLLAALAVLVTACEKPEGEGGNSTIKGKVFIRDYNSAFTLLEASYYAEEERVYIVYGDHDVYDDDFRTHYDGGYEFRYLRKGTYTIYAYSDDSTFQSPSGQIPVMKTVEITENNQTVWVDDLILLK